MPDHYRYCCGEKIQIRDLISTSYGYHIILPLFVDSAELKSRGWEKSPGTGDFVYNYRAEIVDYLSVKILQSEEIQLLGRLKKKFS